MFSKNISACQPKLVFLGKKNGERKHRESTILSNKPQGIKHSQLKRDFTSLRLEQKENKRKLKNAFFDDHLDRK